MLIASSAILLNIRFTCSNLLSTYNGSPLLISSVLCERESKYDIGRKREREKKKRERERERERDRERLRVCMCISSIHISSTARFEF